MSFLVWGPGERVYAVEAGGGTDRIGLATRRDVREDTDEPAQILRKVRRPSADQSSDARTCRCVRRNAPDARLHARRSRQLRRYGDADARRLAQAERLPRRIGWFRRDDGRVS